MRGRSGPWGPQYRNPTPGGATLATLRAVAPGPLRLALVIERFEPAGGGVEAVAWTVAHHLARAGDEVHVFTRRGPSQAVSEGITLHRLRVPTAWQPARVLAFSRAAHRAVRAQGFDVVHAFSRTRHQDLYRAGGGSHADYLARAHGPGGALLRRLSPRHATLLAIERGVFTDPGQTIQCNSDMVRRQLAARYAIADERLAVIVNGVDLERFRPRPGGEARERVRDALGTKRDAPVWLLVGSGFRRKGVDTALLALAAGESDAELWVAGRDDPGPWRARAERAGVGDRARFLGPRSDVEALYAAADALLLPTRYDAFANVCLEAAAAGLPVVTSGANGAATWLGDAGVVVEDADDAGGFARALGALRDPARRGALGRAARARAESRSWASHVEELRALYARIAS